MKRILLFSLLAFAFFATSCADQTSALTFEKFYPLGPTCDVSEFRDSFFVANGSLDVAWGNPLYVVAVSVTGAEGYVQTPTQVGDTVIERANRNEPIIRQMILEYRTSRPLGTTLKPFVVPYTGVAGANVFGGVQVLSPELSQALVDTLTPSNDYSDVIDLSIDMHFEGEMSQSRSKISTGTMTLTLRVFKSAPAMACSNGYPAFSVDATTGDVSCLYNGQSYDFTVPPPRPTAADCCATPGC